jgi:hypothetical protein
MNEYPLYPTLSEEAKKEAQEMLDEFKVKMVSLCEQTISHAYTDISAYIESDHWTNFRNQLLDGLCNYNNRKIHGMYDFKKIRKAIFDEYRDQIIPDLNADLLEEIESLKQQIKSYQDRDRY